MGIPSNHFPAVEFFYHCYHWLGRYVGVSSFRGCEGFEVGYAVFAFGRAVLLCAGARIWCADMWLSSVDLMCGIRARVSDFRVRSRGYPVCECAIFARGLAVALRSNVRI